MLQLFIRPIALVILLVMGQLMLGFGQQFRVLDALDQQPVPGIGYRYGTQSGVTDHEGTVNVEYRADEIIHFTHLTYGHWTLSAAELRKAMDAGVLYRHEQSFTLQPVTVISLKPTDGKDQQIEISDQERLHHDAGAVLNLNPVVNGIRKSGSFAFDPVMRGFKYEQLNVVIDGIHNANAACPNRMDPPTSQVALNRIKQVEILKGPHALRYGIGLGGTINYVQEDPAFGETKRTYGRFSSMYETNGQVTRNEGRLGFAGANHDVGIMASWSRGQDYTDGEGNVIPAGFTRGTVGVYGDFKLGKADLLQVTVNRNFARDVDFPTLGMDLRSDDTWMGSLRHTRSFQGSSLKTWTTSGYFTVVDHVMDNLQRQMNPRMMNAVTPAFTRNFGGRSEGQWMLGAAKLYAGVDFRSEEAQGIRERHFLMGPMAGMTLFDNAWQDSQIGKAGSFASVHLPIGVYVLSASARLDVNHAQARDSKPEFVDVNNATSVTQLNPGISVGVKRDFAEHFQAGIWLARVQRSGSITERFINYFPVGVDPFEMLGNPNLRPETNNQLDFMVGFTKNRFQIEISPFAAYLTDYITGIKTELAPRITSSPGVRQFVNVDRALKAGVELSARQFLGAGISQHVAIAYTYGQNLTQSEALPEIAPFDLRYSLTGSHLNDKLHSAVRLRHVTGQNRVSASFGEMTTPRFTLLDVDASYTLTRQVSLKAGVQNMLNEAYYEHLSRPIGADRRALYAPGRNFFFMLSVKFP